MVVLKKCVKQFINSANQFLVYYIWCSQCLCTIFQAFC